MKERKLFYMYGIGFAPRAMSIGSLILRNYKSPKMVDKYIHTPTKYVCHCFVLLSIC
jgi:hypothetical protein